MFDISRLFWPLLSKQNLILNIQISDFWVCSTKGVGERAGYWSLFFLVGRYMEGNLKDSMINFQDFHVQGSIQACPVFILLTVLFSPPVDYAMKDCWLKEKICYFRNRLTCPKKNSKIDFVCSERNDEIIFVTHSVCFVN